MKYTALIVGVTLCSYVSALAISRTDRSMLRRLILIGNILVNLLLLFLFKYFSFVMGNVAALFHMSAMPFSSLAEQLILPVGISFYTFQAMGYVVDIYRGDVVAEKHLGKFALFISFFPQLVAGPIERTINLLPQISSEKRFSYQDATYGLKLMAWGYFKKLVIADNIAAFIDPLYANVDGYQGFSLVLAAVLFSLQIYCDFSGYSDIAIGAARLFGIRLMTNFASPFFATSLRDFWKRWHISLSTWFRDYVYIPLGGNRKGKWRSQLNLLLTFLISGLWHGQGWNFLIWGSLHGVGRVVESLLPSSQAKRGVNRVMATVMVFAFHTAALVFFRTASAGDAFYIFSHAFSGLQSPIAYLRDGASALGFTPATLTTLTLAILLLLVYDYVSLRTDVIDMLSRTHWLVRWSVYIILVFVILFLMPQQESSHFIYFQF